MSNNVALSSGITLFLIGVAIFFRMDFLLPYRRLLIRDHGYHMAIYATLLGINILALYTWITRKLMFKDSGMKMRHTINQVRDGKLMGDLSERLERRG